MLSTRYRTGVFWLIGAPAIVFSLADHQRPSSGQLLSCPSGSHIPCWGEKELTLSFCGCRYWRTFLLAYVHSCTVSHFGCGSSPPSSSSGESCGQPASGSCCGLQKKLRLRNCGVAVAEQHFFKSCEIAIAELRLRNCFLQIEELRLRTQKKVVHAHLW